MADRNAIPPAPEDQAVAFPETPHEGDLRDRAHAAKLRHKAAKARVKAHSLEGRAQRLEEKAAAWEQKADQLDGVVRRAPQAPFGE